MNTGQVIIGLLIPFAGTTAGAACVFLLKRDFSMNMQRAETEQSHF
jgi:ZIP family zinc transporter